MVRKPTPVYAEAQYRIRSKFDEHGQAMFLAERPRSVLWGWCPVDGGIWRLSREEALSDISRDRHRRGRSRRADTIEPIHVWDIPEWNGAQGRPPKPPAP